MDALCNICLLLFSGVQGSRLPLPLAPCKVSGTRPECRPISGSISNAKRVSLQQMPDNPPVPISLTLL